MADPPGSGPERPPSDETPAPHARMVVLIVAALVVGILVLNLLSALVPGMDGFLAAWPVVVLVLVLGTVVVLAGAMRH